MYYSAFQPVPIHHHLLTSSSKYYCVPMLLLFYTNVAKKQFFRFSISPFHEYTVLRMHMHCAYTKTDLPLSTIEEPVKFLRIFTSPLNVCKSGCNKLYTSNVLSVCGTTRTCYVSDGKLRCLYG